MGRAPAGHAAAHLNSRKRDCGNRAQQIGLFVGLAGSEMVAVRLPAVVCGSLLLASLYVLTVQVSGSDRLALAVAAAGLTVPLITAGSSLMTIDSPYCCCWGWALVLAHRAIFRGSGRKSMGPGPFPAVDTAAGSFSGARET